MITVRYKFSSPLYEQRLCVGVFRGGIIGGEKIYIEAVNLKKREER